MAQGWYEEEGIEIEILPYSGVTGEVLIDQGVADVAFSFPTYVPYFRASGIDVVSIAAVLQSNPTEMAVLADGEIKRPRDLDGGTYGGFGSPAEQLQWEWVIKADGGEGEIEGVILEYGGLRGALRRAGAGGRAVRDVGGDRGRAAGDRAADLEVHRVRDP